jgi:hypothetical protein
MDEPIERFIVSSIVRYFRSMVSNADGKLDAFAGMAVSAPARKNNDNWAARDGARFAKR